MKTGKGGRQAKGGRGGKGSSQRTKTPKTVKAAELEDLSSDDGGEHDTVSLLQSLLGGGSGTSGRVLDLAKRGGRSEKVHDWNDHLTLGLIGTPPPHPARR